MHIVGVWDSHHTTLSSRPGTLCDTVKAMALLLLALRHGHGAAGENFERPPFGTAARRPKSQRPGPKVAEVLLHGLQRRTRLSAELQKVRVLPLQSADEFVLAVSPNLRVRLNTRISSPCLERVLEA